MIKRIFGKLPRIVLYVFMFALSYLLLYPFIYMLSTSLKNNSDLYNFTVVWVPREFHFGNYELAAKIMRFSQGICNSAFVTVCATLGQLLSCSMAGYGMARFRFSGSKIGIAIVVLAMIIPTETIIVPQYLMYVNLDWINTYLPMIVPACLGFGFKGALYIFIFRQFFLGLPRELEEAARVDGCGFLRTFLRIMLPNAKSSYVVVMILAMVWHWSNFFEPSMYITETDMGMLSSGLYNISYILNLPPDTMDKMYDISGDTALNNAVLMAGTFLAILPILIVFCFLQKQFVQGIERSGLTGE